MDVWEWVTSTTSVDRILSTLGLGVVAILFARDLILTRGAHLRRVADIVAAWEQRVQDMLASWERERQALVAHHERELAEKDSRLSDMRESREGYKEATRIERARADTATAGMSELAPAMTSVLHVMESLNRALPNPGEGERND